MVNNPYGAEWGLLSRRASPPTRPAGVGGYTGAVDSDNPSRLRLISASAPPRPRLDLSYLEAIPPTGVTPRQLVRAHLRQACTSSTDPDSPPSPRCTNRT